MHLLCVWQSCGRRRATCSPSTPQTAPSEETAASSGRCCSSSKSSAACCRLADSHRLTAFCSRRSLFFGNLYIYCAWRGHDHITGRERCRRRRPAAFSGRQPLTAAACLQTRTVRRSSSRSPSSAWWAASSSSSCGSPTLTPPPRKPPRGCCRPTSWTPLKAPGEQDQEVNNC